MNNQTEEIDIPGFKYQTVEVSKKDLLRLNEGWSKLNYVRNQKNWSMEQRYSFNFSRF